MDISDVLHFITKVVIAFEAFSNVKFFAAGLVDTSGILLNKLAGPLFRPLNFSLTCSVNFCILHFST